MSSEQPAESTARPGAGRRRASTRAPAKKSAPAADHVLLLPEDCTIRSAAALKASLLECLPLPVLVLDMAVVARVDTAGMQQLAVLVRDRAQAQQQTAWQGRSDALLDAARRLGLNDLLALPAAMLASDGKG